MIKRFDTSVIGEYLFIRFFMMSLSRLISLAVILFTCGMFVERVNAQDVQCPQFFQNKVPPRITQPQEMQGATTLCHTGYATLYSPRVMDPLWSADILTQESVTIGRGIGRHGTFHAEEMLPASQRVYPDDYHNPKDGYWERGHMVPNGDMPTPLLQEETFSMANVVPQDADNNEKLHEGIESATRRLAGLYGKVYVITGPVFSGEKLLRLNNKAFIPTMIFKAIYIPQRGGAAYIENNMAGMQYSVISLEQLNDIAHIDAFPGLSDSEKSKAITLPEPQPSFPGPSREAKARGFYDGKPQLVSFDELKRREPQFISRDKAIALGLIPVAGAFMNHQIKDSYRREKSQRFYPHEEHWRERRHSYDGRRYRNHERRYERERMESLGRM